MTRTITDHEDTLIADLNTAEDTLRDIAKICRNHDIYTSKSLAAIILARIHRKGDAAHSAP